MPRKFLEQPVGSSSLNDLLKVAMATKSVDSQMKAMTLKYQEQVNFVKGGQKGATGGAKAKTKNKKDIRCYRCHKFGHFQTDPNCPAKQEV
jgi:hypothetical protein